MNLGRLTTALEASLAFVSDVLPPAARDWLKDARQHHRLPERSLADRPLLLLVGTYGTGKSTAAEMAGQFVPFGVHFAQSHPLSTLWDNDPLVRQCFETKALLVLDDLGIEGEHDRMIGRVMSILDERKKRGARTIITTNLLTEDLRQRYTDRFLDRVIGDAHIVDCDGDSMRGAGVSLPSVVSVDFEGFDDGGAWARGEVPGEPRSLHIGDDLAKELTDDLVRRLRFGGAA